MQQANQRRYRLGHGYRDSGRVTDPADEFLRWINIAGSGIRNMGGIRPLNYVSLVVPVKAYIVLVTDQRSSGSAANPWEDLIDLPHGRIVYWGDAKFARERGVDDFIGNQALVGAYSQILDRRSELVPPILHFSKTATGIVQFNGLCVLDHLDLTFFEDRGRPVRNYRAHLTVLAEDVVDMEWLHRRARATSLLELENDGPDSWRAYQNGVVNRLQIWASSVRPPESQIPPEGTDDAAVLEQIAVMHPTEFEAAVVALFRQLDEVRHNVTRTRPTADGGFDFYGRFVLPPPLNYEIDFLGEAKRFSRKTPVTPRHVSRLVARLSRGQYGLFVTTSYFTRQAQEEVLADSYPTALFPGSDLVRIMRERGIARGREISPDWLSTVTKEFESGVIPSSRPVTLVAEPKGPYS
jgi:hypothetical protein